MNRFLSRGLASAFRFLLGSAVLFQPSLASAQSTLAAAIAAGKPLIDLRYRYETVDQSNRIDEAHANTVRARLGYQTGSYFGFTALAEFDIVQHIGGHPYCDTVKGCTPVTRYPVVPDPDLTAVNRLQLAYSFGLAGTGMNDTVITVGRQRIAFADQRFVGNVAWRQHEQTFDAISLVNTSLPKTVLTYAYVGQVNRVFGENSVTQFGVFDSHSHFFNALYSGLLPYWRFEAYTYLLDLAQAPQLSTATYGFRGEGKYEIAPGLAAMLTGAFAHQNEYAKNPNAIDLDYWTIEAGAHYRGFLVAIGDEVMSGNGNLGFSAPLGTLHIFQGWADVFLNTPVNGIDDRYAKAAYSFGAAPYFANLTATVVYHDFSAERGTGDFGTEWNAQVEGRIDDNIVLGAKYANYRQGTDIPLGSQTARFDRTVGWLYAMYRY